MLLALLVVFEAWRFRGRPRSSFDMAELFLLTTGAGAASEAAMPASLRSVGEALL